jgi:putative ABC transport system substrate-binding protein
MKRREFIVLLGGALLSPMEVHAQQHAGNTRRIGYLTLGTPTTARGLLEAFRQGLQELGWVEGQNISIGYRFAEGEPEKLPGLAKELLRLKVDVIAAATTPPALAAKNATETIPIVGISF